MSAVDSNNNVVTSCGDTITFASTDAQAPVPAGPAILSSGSGYALALLMTAGSQTITATDTANSSIQGTVTVTITAAPASKVVFTAQPARCQRVRRRDNPGGRYGGRPVWKHRPRHRQFQQFLRDAGGCLLQSERRYAVRHHKRAGRQRRGHLQRLSIHQAGTYALSVIAVGTSGVRLGLPVDSDSFNITATTASKLAFTASPPTRRARTRWRPYR